MEQDQCNAKIKVWTRPAISRNNLFNLHSTGFGICKCGIGQLYALWKRRTRENTEWGSKNCYRHYQTCFVTRSLWRNWLGYSGLETQKAQTHTILSDYTNQTPPYLSTLVPPSVNTFSEYSLRNSNNTQTVHARTTLYYNSFLPSTARERNNLPLECRNSESVNSLKRSINESSVIVPKYYNSGKRRFQILHTRLRTNCSALNNDLFLKRICDSPYCRYGAIENFHFFLNCPSTCRSHTQCLSTYHRKPSRSLIWGQYTLHPNKHNHIWGST